MPRRDVDAILAAHQMDPERRDLYVEGHTEFLFLKVLAGLPARGHTLIWRIDDVDIPEAQEGGNRARVLSLARQVEDTPASIRCFVDADDDWIIDADVPGNVWRTDGRDVESYFLRQDCFAKLGVAANLDSSASRDLLGVVTEIARELGALRIVSTRSELRLPFQRTDIRRSIQGSAGALTLDLRKYVYTLVQGAGHSVSQVPDICDAVRLACEEFASVPDIKLISGKDAMSVLDVALRRSQRSITSQALLGTFERSMVAEYEALDEVVAYL